MSASPRLVPGLSQRVTLAPRLSAALHLLALPATELGPALEAALESNPLLERSEQETAAESSTQAEADGEGDESWELSDWGDPPGEAHVREAAPEPPAEEDLHTYILAQLTFERLSERDQAIALVVVDALDEDGYLRVENVILMETLDAVDPPIAEAEIEAVIRRIQTLEPSGIAARNAAECLLLQLRDSLDESPAVELAKQLLEEYFEQLEQADFEMLVHATGRSRNELEAALVVIRALDPHPGSRLDSQPVEYVNPELLARRSPRGWQVELNPAATPRVSVNETYASWLAARRNDEGGDALAAQLEEARWLVRSLAQREETLLKVGRALVSRQSAFLDSGPEALLPLTLRELADQIGIHESTVSRAVQGKFLATPRGIFSLRRFFSSALPANGPDTAASAGAVQARIQQLIATENPAAPLSDAALAAALAARGIRVARRTIAKYRQAAGLANARERHRPAKQLKPRT